MNPKATALAARTNGASNRRTVNKNAKLAKTAAHVAAVAVAGYLAGFITGVADKPRRRASKK